jgi:hypothetical protein
MRWMVREIKDTSGDYDVWFRAKVQEALEDQ